VPGNFGRILLVDLEGDHARARHVALPPEVYTDYVGGVGLGAYLLWHYAPAGVDPYAPAAPIIYSFSPLLGSPLTTTAKFALLCKSPLTGRICDGLSSSRFALAARRLGVDAVVIRGALTRLSRLHLDEDPARCRVDPCPELRGLSAAAVQDLLQRTGVSPHVSAIGAAGEARVRYATVSNDGRHAGRGGAGAVFGAKQLKAITVRGGAVAGVADPAAVQVRARELVARSRGVATDKYRRLGTASNLETFDRLRILPARNFQTVSIGAAAARRLAPEGLTAAAGHTRDSCAGCTIGCDHRYGGQRLEYETQFALGPLCGVAEPERLLAAARACDEFGLDTISAGGTLAFAMECGERGLFDRIDRLEGAAAPRFGDDLVPWLARIAGRSGAGDLLAEGTRRAAAVVGGGSAAFACHVKGLELPGYEPRAMQTMALGLCVASRGADHNRSGAYQADLRPGVDRYHADPTRAPALVIETEDLAALLDSLILCKFLRGAVAEPWREGAELLAMVTGLDFDEATLRRAARRIAAMRHAFNLREGWTIAEDRLPDRFYDEALSDAPALDRAGLAAQVAAYHAARGRGPDGAAAGSPHDLADRLESGRESGPEGRSCAPGGV
jgi:aldehyde:ferredoxin oxidoreductase